ncbi:calpain-5-like [Ylistrum balloti]|uniref:calpain-5-like n=1 Tax=Ylistrum balloti TaxID=509963 RepID=UPI002905F67B|nr:calpain-5-like [Ylistrum balloti]
MVLGLTDSTVPYKGQKYYKIKSSCSRGGKLFVDKDFPPSGSSLFFSRPAPADIVWKRPSDICANPKFFTEGASADDFSQGSLGNCWFVAACACIAEDPKLWKKIVPDPEEQEWQTGKKHAGIFHFKFWQCGQWLDVVIDDYLPTRYGRLIFAHSKSGNEFWPALLEKAYAKLFGDYESLIAGKARDAMVDMTGGVGEGIELEDYRTEEDKKKLFKILRNSFDNRSLMSASIRATGREMESQLSCGLVKGHAYSITAVKKIKLVGKNLFAVFNRQKMNMIRLRNPWGGTEWRGPWSDGSSEWKKVSESDKKELGLTFDDNGEFWMAFEDFYRYFTSMDICHMINTSFFSFKKTWKQGKAFGEWKRQDRCGGCGNNGSFLNNPQYVFTVEEDDAEVLLSLEQWDKRIDKDKGKSNDTIGCTVMKTDLNRKYRMHDRMDRVHSGPFSNARGVFARINLKSGTYCIIPSTFEPGKTGKYLLRVFCTTAPMLRELVDDEPRPPQCCGVKGIKKPKVAATQITVVRAEALEAQDWDGAADPYCVIHCNKKSQRTKSIPNTVNPEWNERVTFYRQKPNKDIRIEVWNHNIIKDEFMGVCVLPMSEKNSYRGGNTIRRFDLTGRGKDSTVKRRGYLWLKVLHSGDMTQV